jgi:hypothetical protein
MKAHRHLVSRLAPFFAAVLLGAPSLLACSSAGPGSGGGTSGGVQGTIGSSGTGSGSGSGGGGDQPGCVDPGGTCSGTKECCQSGNGIGPEGQVCVSDDNACHAVCLSSSECKSGCCIKLSGVSFGNCGEYASGYTCL